MRAPLFLTMLAALALFTACALIVMRFREAANERISTITHAVAVPAAFGNQSSTGGWHVGAFVEESEGTRCVSIASGFGESRGSMRN